MQDDKAAERERRRQAWQRHLDADKANFSPARLRSLLQHIEDSNIQYVGQSKASAAHYHLAYYLRTGKKFLDLQEARFHLILSRRQITLIVRTPQQRCRQCRKNRKRLTPLDKSVRSNKLNMKALPLKD